MENPTNHFTKKVAVVALVGRPNAGKSTLLNAILGEQISIVTPKAQTTRDQIRGIHNTPEGQLVFVDTPGIHEARPGGFNEKMMKQVTEALSDPDLIVYLIDPSSGAAHEEKVRSLIQTTRVPVIPVLTKCDLPYADEKVWLEEWANTWRAERSTLQPLHRMSARENTGVQELLTKLYALAPLGHPLFDDEDQLTDRSVRFLSSELIRKQLFMCLGDEVPYSTAVEIDSFKEDQKPVRIEATIFVERDSQKGMVIGAGGKKIKEIGSKARAEIETLMQENVFLGLRVKVLEDWTKAKKISQGRGR